MLQLEKLFDKLIENEGLEYDEFKELLKNNKEGENIFEIESPQKTILNSNTEDSILSILRSDSICNVDESVLNDGNHSFDEHMANVRVKHIYCRIPEIRKEKHV